MNSFNPAQNRAVWFDIPVADMERAAEFYSAVLNLKIHKQEFDGVSFCVFDQENGNSGSLVPNETEISSNAGVLIYLNVHGRIRDAVSQVEKHGGKVLQRIHSIGSHGFRAVVLDSEGNRIALHSYVDA